MESKLYRIILPVKDIDKAEQFYSQILGQKGNRVSPGRHYFNLGETILACYDPKADGDAIETWSFHSNQYLYIAVANLQQIWEKVKTMNAKYVGDINKMPWGEVLFYANDPFGNPICFVDHQTVFLG